VTEKLEEVQIKNFADEARSQIPELKDKDSPITKEVLSMLGDKEQYDKWVKQGKNPLVEAMRDYRKNHFDEYMAIAKQQGIQEGEDKAVKASRAVVEGGGKQAIEENMSMEKFDSMSSAEMEKYLISKGAIRR
jgi:hypothetical protein